MRRKKNTEAIVQITILIGIAMLLLYSMLSKKVNYYVHPRFHIGLWLSIIILFIFAISLISNIKKARHNVNIKHYIIFLIPLVAALVFPVTGVSNTGMALAEGNNSSTTDTERNKEEKSSDELTNTNTDVIDNEELPEESDSSSSIEETDSFSEEDASEKYSKYEAGGITIINDDIFADWYCDVYDNLAFFVGKKYQYIAQVYSMDDFKENQFLAGRYFMICCAADLEGYGLICESDIRSELKDDQWITVTGTIVQYEYDEMLVPMLTDVTITKAEAPENEYIYYNNY